MPLVEKTNETLSVVLRCLEHTPYLTGLQSFIFAVHQAVPNSTVHAIAGRELFTEVNRRRFWPSVAIIGVIAVGYCFVGFASMAAIKYTKCDDVDIGISPEEVARLATMEFKTSQERKA